MAIYVDLEAALGAEAAPAPQALPDYLYGPVLRADVTQIDDCPVLDKLKAFIAEQRTTKTLEWTLRDRKGSPISLALPESEEVSGSSGSLSDSFGVAIPESWSVVARFRPALGESIPHPTKDNFYEAVGHIYDAASGVVHVPLQVIVSQQCGIWEVSFGIKDSNGVLLYVDRAWLSVERNLFGDPLDNALGPPTIQEIRLSMRDSLTENLWLDNVEFDGAEVVQAILRCIQFWNESLPPIRPLMTASTFPYREHWLIGIQGYLLDAAASHYRRTLLKHTAGGTMLGDKDKEREYLSAAKEKQEQFAQWVLNTKVAINTKRFAGYVGSSYGRHGF